MWNKVGSKTSRIKLNVKDQVWLKYKMRSQIFSRCCLHPDRGVGRIPYLPMIMCGSADKKSGRGLLHIEPECASVADDIAFLGVANSVQSFKINLSVPAFLTNKKAELRSV